MRFIGTFGLASRRCAHALALLSVIGLLSGCPKKETEAAPEPAAATPTSDKAGAEPPAAAAPAAEAPATAAPAATPAPAAAKKKKDEGGW